MPIHPCLNLASMLCQNAIHTIPIVKSVYTKSANTTATCRIHFSQHSLPAPNNRPHPTPSLCTFPYKECDDSEATQSSQGNGMGTTTQSPKRILSFLVMDTQTTVSMETMSSPDVYSSSGNIRSHKDIFGPCLDTGKSVLPAKKQTRDLLHPHIHIPPHPPTATQIHIYPHTPHQPTYTHTFAPTHIHTYPHIHIPSHQTTYIHPHTPSIPTHTLHTHSTHPHTPHTLTSVLGSFLRAMC